MKRSKLIFMCPVDPVVVPPPRGKEGEDIEIAIEQEEDENFH